MKICGTVQRMGRAGEHFLALLAAESDVEFLELHALAVEEHLGAHAVGAGEFGIHINLGRAHCISFPSLLEAVAQAHI